MTKEQEQDGIGNGAIIAIVAGVAGVGLTLADKYNVFQMNPTGQWWWERIFPAPAPTVRFQPQFRPQPAQLSPRQELNKAQLALTGSQQVVNDILRRNPSLATNSKYVLTS